MLIRRRNDERRHFKHRRSKVWQTFDVQSDSSPLARSFGDLVSFDEIRVPPGGALPNVNAGADTFTYVHTGVLEHRSAGSSSLQRAGDFQCSAKSDPHEERNASRKQWARVFRLRIASSSPRAVEGDERRVQQRFTAARRHNSLCAVASPDGASGSLALGSDVFIYSSVVDMGHHIVHALQPTRCAWLHMVRGKARVGEFELSEGDGIGVSESVAVSLTAQEDSEILLVDLGVATLAS